MNPTTDEIADAVYLTFASEHWQTIKRKHDAERAKLLELQEQERQRQLREQSTAKDQLRQSFKARIAELHRQIDELRDSQERELDELQQRQGQDRSALYERHKSGRDELAEDHRVEKLNGKHALSSKWQAQQPSPADVAQGKVDGRFLARRLAAAKKFKLEMALVADTPEHQIAELEQRIESAWPHRNSKGKEKTSDAQKTINELRRAIRELGGVPRSDDELDALWRSGGRVAGTTDEAEMDRLLNSPKRPED